ncbi:MAG TPA: glycoside hydrolase family 31 protein [Aggregatilinea sp.]|uniref:glycoside hydrolase family 31 protein n=1 Tax=Aggregatilinea sp. TaxID=2806333 RepID=UPI002B91AF3F|nr:glycoside hydrolase family 31 protein [Aggregatilinea sp.]HML23875.1 glycoside hydrolase family 31 protein [Aggregatilinea sp.]
MGFFAREAHRLVWQENQHKVWLQAWGANGLRVRANLAGQILDLPQALLDPDASAEAEIEIGDSTASIRSGVLQATVTRDGRISFINTETGETLLAERERAMYYTPPSRDFKRPHGRLYQIEAWFEAQPGERFYGLGQHQHGQLNQEGCVIELQQRNTEISIPFMVSTRKYGFLWNNPSIGRVELGRTATRWVANGAQQLDYYVTCGSSYAEILEHYADATGHAPTFPDWASGFWQCKLRYETQDDLLKVAREYKARGLPLSVIVSDFFNWAHMGDWKFHPEAWPNPAAMVSELEEMGVKLMVSIWPTVSPISENYATMTEHGLLINNEAGVDAQHVFVDHDINGPAYMAYYDATNPEAREFIWETIKRSYYAQGVRLWWLDNDEPDINPWMPENLRFYLGNGEEVANIYPLLHQMGFYEHMRDEGETEILTLSRSAWAGSQRYGALMWSGDIASTFEALQAQVRCGLNMAMSGIPWWTTDIGGFHDGDIRTPTFRELMVRWFQYGVFSPVCRLHGYRLPADEPVPASGAENEVWSFGNEVYAILRDLLDLRERLRPYIHAQMERASASGLPVMRPLLVDFPDDPACETIDDEFMFGPEILVAPVLHEGARSRKVYLPPSTRWTDAHTGESYDGGRWIDASTPLDTIPVYLRAGSGLESVFRR